VGGLLTGARESQYKITPNFEVRWYEKRWMWW